MDACEQPVDVEGREGGELLQKYINEYFEKMLAIVQAHGGDVVDAHAEPDLERLVDELDPTVDRAALEAYSRSMPGAVPSTRRPSGFAGSNSDFDVYKRSQSPRTDAIVGFWPSRFATSSSSSTSSLCGRPTRPFPNSSIILVSRAAGARLAQDERCRARSSSGRGDIVCGCKRFLQRGDDRCGTS